MRTKIVGKKVYKNDVKIEKKLKFNNLNISKYINKYKQTNE